MKTPIRMLLASAAFLIGVAAGRCLAATQVTMDLSNQVLKSGSSIVVTSGTETIDPARIYYYSISGTVIGTGTLAALTGTGCSLSEAMTLADPPLVTYLAGNVYDASATFPFTCVNKVEPGHYEFQSGPLDKTTVYGTVHIKAGIKKNGTCYGELTNVLFGFSNPLLGRAVHYDKMDSLVFQSGAQIVVQTTPFGGPPQPDLSFLVDGQLVGVGITGTNGAGESTGKILAIGQSLTIPVFLQNIGSAPDSYTLSATKLQAGWVQTFIYKGKNVTAAILDSANGFTIPPDIGTTPETLASGGITTLTWIITNRDAVSFFSSAILTATSKTDPSAQDALGATVITPD